MLATLKHFAGYSASRGGPQPRAGVDGPARAARRDPAAVRDGRHARRGRLGDELLLRRRRRARPAPTRWLLTERAARRVGLHRHRRLRLLGGAVPRHHAPGRGRRRRGGRAGAGRRHRRRAARHHRLRRRAGRAGAPRRACRRSWSTGPPAGCSRRRSSSGCSTRTGRRRARWPAAGGVDLDSPANRALARELAERSIVLLDAGTGAAAARRRPTCGRVAVVGPCAADPRTFMGCYAFPNHVLPRYPGLGLGIDVPTAVDALRAELPDVEIVHEPGCAVQRRRPVRASPPRVAAARERRPVRRVRRRPRRACSATAPPARAATPRTCGCPGVQADLLDELLATGTPVVVVVVSGRPYALGDVHGRAAGLVQAFMPGEEGGAAIAGVLSGPGPARRQAAGADPAARRAASRAPTCSRRSAAPRAPASATSTRPRCSRSATAARTPRFAVDDLRISAAEVPTDGEFTVDRAGPQHRRRGPATRSSSSTCTTWSPRWPGRCGSWSASPGCRSSRARPRDVTFRVHADRTAFTGRDLRARSSSPARSRCCVGTSAADLPCRGTRPADRAAAGGGRTTAGWSPRWTLQPARRRRVGGGRGVGASARSGRATLATVAASAGVSVATVSKVLNGRADVAPATRARVQTCCEQHDYVGRRGAGPAQRRPATVELVFARRAQRLLHRDHPGRAGRRRPRRASPSRSASARAAPRVGRGPIRRPGRATWSPPAAQAVIDVVNDADRGATSPRWPGPGCRSSSSTRSTCPAARVTSVGVDQLRRRRWPRPSTCSRSGTAASPTSAARPTAACNQARMHGYRAAMEAAGVPVPDGYVRDGQFRYQDGVDGRRAPCSTCRSRPTAVFAGSDEVARRASSRRPARAGCACPRTSAWSASTTPSSPGSPRRR